MALINKVVDLLLSKVCLVIVLFKIRQRLLQVVDLFIIRQVFVMHKPIYHMIMGVFKNSIIIDKLDKLVRLDLLRYRFLDLDEVIERLKLLGHVVNSVVYNFFNLYEFMVTSKACHLWIRISMLLQTIFT